MAVKAVPQDVADAFVNQYYTILNRSPENLHKFYQESSLLGWQGPDGVVTPVTTLSGISEKIMSTDYKDCTVEIKTTDAQQSSDGGIIVAVTGFSTGNDNVKRNFSQTFFLATQETGFFVLNDILRVFDVCESITVAPAKDEDQSAPSMQTSAPQDIPDSPKSPHTKGVEREEVKEDIYPTLKDSVAKVASKSLVAPLEKPRPVVAPASNVKEESKKITYASMVAKETRVTSPRTALVTSNGYNLAVASPKAKSSVPLNEGVLKVSTPPRSVSQAPLGPSKVSPKLAAPSNGAPNSGAYPDAKGIYIGRLPYDISKQGVVEVIKKFGPVRRNADNIQIRRHDDGYCCGFVEFESADSARRAVEAHHVYFGDKEAYITYKKSSYNRGNDGRGRSPTRSGSGNGNENQAGYNKGAARSPRPNRSGTK